MKTDARDYTALSREQVRELVGRDSIICLPLGSTEQHGPHLPIETDSVLAGGFTDRLVAAYGEQLDLWRLPTVPFGLSREHAGSPGTISLTVATYCATLHGIVAGLVESSASRNLALVNGHGGNRGVLEALVYELQSTYGVSVAVLHPTALSSVKSGSAWPEVHGGKSETSVMMELAPHLVDVSLLPGALPEGAQPDVRAKILDRGVTWPWKSGDSRLSTDGIIGDAAAATPELGREIVSDAVQRAESVLTQIVAEQHRGS
ncbi:creatininase family protein [Brooklawnia propionicigenes]|uniref:Creatininase family protein n=1 Tax=Brooklawnia propionicigenes TaxID=3041175 RepID=A0AAN0K952_9ACTN|nr:creatininase family protein [Brooklawnia sp. SH051]BEH03141.1 creatininase family protein [Brooklawnia sp. SH051]